MKLQKHLSPQVTKLCDVFSNWLHFRKKLIAHNSNKLTYKLFAKGCSKALLLWLLFVVQSVRHISKPQLRYQMLYVGTKLPILPMTKEIILMTIDTDVSAKVPCRKSITYYASTKKRQLHACWTAGNRCDILLFSIWIFRWEEWKWSNTEKWSCTKEMSVFENCFHVQFWSMG